MWPPMPEQERSEGLATGIYGTILSTALIAAYSEDPGSDPVQVAVAVIVAALVFWVTAIGVAIAWRRGSGLAGIAFSAAASAVFGIVVVALKAIVH